MIDAVKEHSHLLALKVLIVLWAVVITFIVDVRGENIFAFVFNANFVFAFFSFPLIVVLFSYFYGLDNGRSLFHLPKSVVNAFNARNLVRYLISFMVIYFVAFVCAKIKSLISFVVPFQHDVLLSEWDRWLHFGRYPHEYLSFILDSPKLIWFIDGFYVSWFYYIYAYMAFVVFQDRHTLGRMSAIICFCLSCFLLGNLFAMLSSSVGPIYWEYYVDEPNPYTDLLSKLSVVNDATPLYHIEISQMLLDWQNDANVIDLNGPSSMPSMHVAIAALLFFHSWAYCKWLLPVTVIYLIGTLVGSVVLSWHYAIDGYASIILMYVIWWGVEKYFKRRSHEIENVVHDDV
jgi:hypothetical protein